jgi:hypothetical protein
VCFRWTAGPDTRLLIAAVSLMLFVESRGGTNMAGGRAGERGLYDALDMTCSLPVIRGGEQAVGVLRWMRPHLLPDGGLTKYDDGVDG